MKTITVIRKPIETSVVHSVLAGGVGAVNVDVSRVPMSDEDRDFITRHCRPNPQGDVWTGSQVLQMGLSVASVTVHARGRWPANVILVRSEKDCPVKWFDEQNGVLTSGAMKRPVDSYDGHSSTGFLRGDSGPHNQYGDSGGASRFFTVIGGVYVRRSRTDDQR